jgi:hypothetical protein
VKPWVQNPVPQNKKQKNYISKEQRKNLELEML